MELIQRGNRTFRVVPEARKVIGKKTTKTNPYVELMRIAKKTDDGLIFNLLWDYFCEKEVTSEAVCDPRDEWDWTKGIDIANAKLDLKDHMWMAKCYSAAYRRLMTLAAKMFNLCKHHMMKAEAIRDDLERTYWRDNEETD